MKNWRLSYKVAFINCSIVVFIGLICGFASTQDGFAFTLGLVCLAGAIINSILSLLIYLASSNDWAKGFLLAAGILFLLSGISCGTGLANGNY